MLGHHVPEWLVTLRWIGMLMKSFLRVFIKILLSFYLVLLTARIKVWHFCDAKSSVSHDLSEIIQRNISCYYQCWKQLCCFIFLWKMWCILWWIEPEQHFLNIPNVISNKQLSFINLMCSFQLQSILPNKSIVGQRSQQVSVYVCVQRERERERAGERKHTLHR